MINGNYGTNVKVEPSTLKPNHAWLFVRHNDHGNVLGALHLDKASAQELINQLLDILGDFW